ncbi:hypothetical protein F2P81_021799 [Scophthalmus maximus]|uniref:Uncharacterized protein n=1 Tax=Scophthalmus maximus TaxID=52904 RepID=A0A6A4RYC0_SCOMX|nr:hypothetical protein F2P81_021799 [Scophthalmus maximus]
MADPACGTRATQLEIRPLQLIREWRGDEAIADRERAEWENDDNNKKKNNVRAGEERTGDRRRGPCTEWKNPFGPSAVTSTDLCRPLLVNMLVLQLLAHLQPRGGVAYAYSRVVLSKYCGIMVD